MSKNFRLNVVIELQTLIFLLVCIWVLKWPLSFHYLPIIFLTNKHTSAHYF